MLPTVATEEKGASLPLYASASVVIVSIVCEVRNGDGLGLSTYVSLFKRRLPARSASPSAPLHAGTSCHTRWNSHGQPLETSPS